MSTYEAWRITYKSSEAAARAAYNTVEKLHEENQALRKHVDGLRAALGAQVRFGSEGFLAAIEKLPRYTYNYASEDGKFLLRDEVLAAIASQARQATPTADMGNTTSQPPSATEAGNPASGAQDKMSTTQQPAALRLADKYEAHGFLGDHRFAKEQWCSQAAVDLHFQHLVAPPADPMDWPLPCDVTVGHGTMRKGVALRTLVLRMKGLYEMATGQNADEVAARTPEQRAELLSAFQAKIAPQAVQAAAHPAEGATAQAVKLLAADHSGMKVDYRGLFSQVQRALKRTDPGHAEMLRQLEGHLQELGQRWYAGDTAVVDELLQLYSVECQARDALAAQAEQEQST